MGLIYDVFFKKSDYELTKEEKRDIRKLAFGLVFLNGCVKSDIERAKNSSEFDK